MNKAFGVLVLAAFVAAGGCGGSGDSTSPGNTGGNNNGGAPVLTNAVTVSDDVFSPPNIQVSPGTTVVWTWSANAGLHNVTFNDAASQNLTAGGSYARIFATAGTFAYLCTLHSAVMTGSVLVK
jgi:plastocyanin